MNFLGHTIDATGYRPTDERIGAITLEEPQNAKQVARFIGMMNFYRKHIDEFAEILHPLYEACKDYHWGQEQQQAFAKAKMALVQHITLRPPDQTIPFVIYTDASDTAVGATILQRGEPVACFSARMSPAEKKYATFDK